MSYIYPITTLKNDKGSEAPTCRIAAIKYGPRCRFVCKNMPWRKLPLAQFMAYKKNITMSFKPSHLKRMMFKSLCSFVTWFIFPCGPFFRDRAKFCSWMYSCRKFLVLSNCQSGDPSADSFTEPDRRPRSTRKGFPAKERLWTLFLPRSLYRMRRSAFRLKYKPYVIFAHRLHENLFLP